MDISLELFLIFGISFLVVVLFVAQIILHRKFSKLRTRYEVMMNGQGVADLEKLLVTMQQTLTLNEQQINDVRQHLTQLSEKLKLNKGKTAIKRYKAFADHGSDLSFSIALLDDFGDGIVLSGIHHSEYSYIYAKPIKDGQSEYKLTPEEVSVIHQANGH